jgi:hypothetical protein
MEGALGLLLLLEIYSLAKGLVHQLQKSERTDSHQQTQ